MTEELEMKMTMDYDPKQIYKDISNNYIKVKFSLKAYQNGEIYEDHKRNKVYLKILHFDGGIDEKQVAIVDFEKQLMAGEVEEYFPDDVERAKLALRGFLNH